MLRRRFLIKADRMFKKPKPGRKRLVKWPKKLVPAESPLVRLIISPILRLACKLLAICLQHTNLTSPLQQLNWLPGQQHALKGNVPLPSYALVSTRMEMSRHTWPVSALLCKAPNSCSQMRSCKQP